MRRKENEKDMITDRTQNPKELDFEAMLKEFNKEKQSKRGKRSKRNRRRDK